MEPVVPLAVPLADVLVTVPDNVLATVVTVLLIVPPILMAVRVTAAPCTVGGIMPLATFPVLFVPTRVPIAPILMPIAVPFPPPLMAITVLFAPSLQRLPEPAAARRLLPVDLPVAVRVEPLAKPCAELLARGTALAIVQDPVPVRVARSA